MLGQVVKCPRERDSGHVTVLLNGNLVTREGGVISFLVFISLFTFWLPLLKLWHPAPRVFVVITHIPHMTPSAPCQRWKLKSVNASFICVITKFHFLPSLTSGIPQNVHIALRVHEITSHYLQNAFPPLWGLIGDWES